MYLLFAIKPDSADYCRGCLMASYSAESFYENYLSPEKLIARLAEYYARNLQLDCGEKGFGFIIFRNGIKVYDSVDGHGWCWDGGDRWEYESDEYWDNEELNDKERDEAYTELDTLIDKGKELASVKVEQIKEKAKQEKLLAQQKEAERAKEHRRKEFEKLKTEFS